jgi:colicin import membrane protein
MTGFFLFCSLWAVSVLSHAQTLAPQAQMAASSDSQRVADHATLSEAERQAHSQHLAQRRQQLDDAYKQDMTACYQKFDVITCRNAARERRIQANALLRQEELKFNAAERQIKAAEAQRRMAEKAADGQSPDALAQRAGAVQQAQKRAQAHAQKQIDHANQGGNRDAYEAKQREAAEHRANVEKKRRERDKPPAAPLPVPGAAK